MQTNKNIVALLQEEHASLQLLFEDAFRIKSEKELHEIHFRISTQLRACLKAEEAVVYPTLADKGFSALGDQLSKEHSDLKELLIILDTIMPDHEDWINYFSGFRKVVNAHFEKEEKKLFPIFASKRNEEELLDLAGKFLNAKEMVAPAVRKVG